MNLDMINRYDLAVELLALDARIKIVTEHTGFSAKILRRLAFQMHQRSSAKGSLKVSRQFFTRVSNFIRKPHSTRIFFELTEPVILPGDQSPPIGATLRLLKPLQTPSRFLIL
jgi:hypothetical protein